MTRILVTGSAGFVGRALTRCLADIPGAEIVAGVRRPTDGAFAADLAERKALRDLVCASRPDVVVHAAGRHEGPASSVWRDNALAGQFLIEAVRALPTTRLVIIGSAAEYGPSNPGVRHTEASPCKPRTDYGRAKLAVTQAAAEAAREGLDVTVLRAFNVIGPGIGRSLALGAFLERAADALHSGEAVHMGRLDGVRDYVGLCDLTEVVRRVVERGASTPVINVCTGIGRSLGQLLEEFMAVIGQRISIVSETSLAPADHSVGDPALCLKETGVLPSAKLDGHLLAAWQGAGVNRR